MHHLEDHTAAIKAATQTRLFPTSAPPAADIEHDRETIIGIERRLEREEHDGYDTTLARLAVSKRYSTYAASMVRKAGGDVDGMKNLTDKNNMAPLAWSGGQCPKLD